MGYSLQDLTDITPSAKTVNSDTPSDTWEFVTAGPDVQDDGGNQILNVLPGILRVGDTANHIKLDPADPVIKLDEDATDRLLLGKISAGVYGLQVNNAAGTAVIQIDTNQAKLAGWDLTENTLTSSSGVVGLNSEVTEGTDWRFWAGHAIPGSAPFRVDEDGNLIALSVNLSGAITAKRGTIDKLAVLLSDILETDITSSDDSNIIRLIEDDNTRITEDDNTRISEGMYFLETKGNETFAVGDILRLRDNTDDEWLEVGVVNSSSEYYVYRDKSGNYGSDNNPTWKKGASVINYKQSGDGAVYMTASESNAPYLSVFTHEGSPWSFINTRLRIGNLNGYLGYNSDEYGIAIGDASNNLKYDPTNGLVLTGPGITSGSLQDEAGNMIIDLDAATITVSQADGLVIDSAGGMKVESGGDITLEGDDSNAAKLIFDGTSYAASFGATSNGIYTGIWPNTAGVSNFHIGYDVENATEKRFGYINLLAESFARSWAQDTLSGVKYDGLIAAEPSTITLEVLSGDLKACSIILNHIEGSSPANSSISMKTDGDNQLVIDNNGDATFSENIFLSNGNYIGISGAERLEFHTDGAAAFMGCDVGINETSPQNKLDVSGAAVIGSSYAGTNTAPSNGLLVEGYVGIGDAYPAYQLSVFSESSNNEYRIAEFRNDWNSASAGGIEIIAGADNGSGTTSYVTCRQGNTAFVGNLSNINGTFSLVDSSDEILKTEIEDTKIDCLAGLKKAKVRDYKWRDIGENAPVIQGFVAQEMQKCFPNVVTTGPDQLLGVSLTGLIPFLTRSVQQVDDKVIVLENKIKELEKQIQTLKAA